MALEATQAQAGHASIETTRIYPHLSNDWLAGSTSGRWSFSMAALMTNPLNARPSITG